MRNPRQLRAATPHRRRSPVLQVRLLVPHFERCSATTGTSATIQRDSRAGGLGFAQIEDQFRHIGEVDEALPTILDRDRAILPS